MTKPDFEQLQRIESKIEALQQQLLTSQAQVVQLREMLNKCKGFLAAMCAEDEWPTFQSDIDKALSTPPPPVIPKEVADNLYNAGLEFIAYHLAKPEALDEFEKAITAYEQHTK